ncbi:MAG: hypothetical protein MZW92_38370 [Comamonadaceae bacterium]|nr:hypothetical protein [Comamonadaceae bacterium]
MGQPLDAGTEMALMAEPAARIGRPIRPDRPAHGRASHCRIRSSSTASACRGRRPVRRGTRVTPVRRGRFHALLPPDTRRRALAHG